MGRRILSLWLTNLASDRFLRGRGGDDLTCAFVVVGSRNGAMRIICVSRTAQAAGLRRGMALTDARAVLPELVTATERPERDAGFLSVLGRWCERYTPRIATDGADGLFLDVTGCAHLHGGETALLHDLLGRLEAQGIQCRAGIADTKGAAWAMARYGQDDCIAPVGEVRAVLAPLPVAALQIDTKLAATLTRLGVKHIGDIAALPSGAVARRFGPGLVQQLEAALGTLPDPVSAAAFKAPYAVRLSLPEPIGHTDDVTAALDRLLVRLCTRLERERRGARTLRLTIQRVDRASEAVEVSLSRPSSDPTKIAPLFERHIGALDAGFGIDALRLKAVVVEKIEPTQKDAYDRLSASDDRIHDVIARIGSRIGFDRIVHAVPAESHIPERAYKTFSAAHCTSQSFDEPTASRPLILFDPEPVVACDRSAPPEIFRWRKVTFRMAHAIGPERIAPEWWNDDPAWRSGPRDYWWVQTEQGRRLWLYRTYGPDGTDWFAQGEFA